MAGSEMASIAKRSIALRSAGIVLVLSKLSVSRERGRECATGLRP
jgi:hypothetical protein